MRVTSHTASVIVHCSHERAAFRVVGNLFLSENRDFILDRSSAIINYGNFVNSAAFGFDCLHLFAWKLNVEMYIHTFGKNVIIFILTNFINNSPHSKVTPISALIIL